MSVSIGICTCVFVMNTHICIYIQILDLSNMCIFYICKICIYSGNIHQILMHACIGYILKVCRKIWAKSRIKGPGFQT